jgi:uncharacterized protein (UPF0332 family)
MREVLEEGSEPPPDEVEPLSLAKAEDGLATPAHENDANVDGRSTVGGEEVEIQDGVGVETQVPSPESAASVAFSSADKESAGAFVGGVPADTRAPGADSSSGDGASEEPRALSSPETRARGRLRLSQLVLAAGFLGDALRAAYEALFAAIAGLGKGPAPEGHAGLVAMAYRELLPSGKLPREAPAALAKLHDLATLDRSGVPLDTGLVEEAVAEVEGWVRRLEEGGGPEGQAAAKGVAEAPKG